MSRKLYWKISNRCSHKMKMATISKILLLTVAFTAALAYAQAPPDALGAIQSSPTTCEGNLTGGTCYALDITCPQLPDYTAYIKIYDPTVPVIGTVLFVTGGDGTDLVEDRMYGPVVVQ